MSSRRQRIVWSFAGALGLLAAAYAVFTGPSRLDRYPDRTTSPYRLPWPDGVARFCAQSNRGLVSHRGFEEFAYDFYMPVGSTVCAARDGVVAHLETRHHGQGLNAPNNYVAIDHGDGTTAWYLHVEKGGNVVQPGDEVHQGQPIARSGNVGRSTAPHLHFEVKDTRGATIPVSFADVPQHRGVPRMFFRYTSRNRPR